MAQPDMTAETSAKRHILIVEDEPNMAILYEHMLAEDGYALTFAQSAREAIDLVSGGHFDVAITDLTLSDMNGIGLLRRLKPQSPELQCIVVTGFGTIESAVEAMREGAFDYLTKPIQRDELRIVVSKAIEQADLFREIKRLRAVALSRFSFDNIIGKSNKMQDLFRILARVADSATTVLIQGESGTGKELIAKALHAHSARRDRPFVTVNSSALPEALLESELFGHAKGAFTGAIRAKKGLFQEADGGTLFLDEIGDISPNMQAKLLRALQEREVKPVGSNETARVDVRVVAATNRDLKAAVTARTFREDLYYRIAVVSLQMPPLRDRREDVPLLVHHFLKKYAEENRRVIEGISPAALGLLMSQPWQGNVRELENVIERAVVISDTPLIDLVHLPPEVRGLEMLLPDLDTTHFASLNDAVSQASRQVEKQVIARALKLSNGNRTRACTLLRISRGSLYNKLKEYEMS